jgi:hypothetical protein
MSTTARAVSIADLKQQALEAEVARMLDNENPLTGIYSIYGDYPIEKWNEEQWVAKKLERVRAAR